LKWNFISNKRSKRKLVPAYLGRNIYYDLFAISVLFFEYSE